MKRILILLLLGLPVWLRGAPFPLGPDMAFSVDFVALSNAPAVNIPFGTGVYNRNYEVYDYLTNSGYYVSSIITNEFSISIDLGTNANAEGWIVQLEEDGSFTPIKDFGTPVYGEIYPPYYYGALRGPAFNYSNSFQLSVEQAQMLAAGRWYADIKIGDDEFLGQLTSTYMRSVYADTTFFGPTFLSTPSPRTFFPQRYFIAIAPRNDRPATVTLASSSIDVFYLPMDVAWNEGDQWAATTTTTTRRFSVGTHLIGLNVSDLYGSDTNAIQLEVITPADAVGHLISGVQYSPSKVQKWLMPPLVQAQNAFNHNNTFGGIIQLKMFIYRVNSQPAGRHSTLGFEAQQIIDAVR